MLVYSSVQCAFRSVQLDKCTLCYNSVYICNQTRAYISVNHHNSDLCFYTTMIEDNKQQLLHENQCHSTEVTTM